MAIGTSIKVGLDSKAVAQGFAKIKSGFKRLSASVKMAGRAMMAPFLKLQTILAPLLVGGGGVVLLKNASKQAAEIEKLGTAFVPLLGGMDAATKRIQELKRFSIRTPFEPEEVIKASKVLETMGGEILSTGKGLEMVGDAAAVANQPLEEVAIHMGRIFGALTSGGSAGESVGRLQELGLITGTAKIGFERLAASQKKGEVAAASQSEALLLLQQVLGKTEGAMADLSVTFAGRVSTLKGNWSELLETLGIGLNVGIGGLVDEMNQKLPTLAGKFQSAGEKIGDAISSVMGSFEQGNFGALVWSGLKFAMVRFAEEMVALMKYAGQVLGQEIGDALARTDIGKKLGMMQTHGARMSIDYYRAQTKGTFSSGDALGRVRDQARVAKIGRTEEWLKKMNWTEEQILETLNGIRRKGSAAAF